MSIKIYHNPRCTKSRQTLQLLEEKGIAPEVILYLETPPKKAEIEGLLKALKLNPHDILRKGEAEYKENNLGAKTQSDAEIVEIIANNPKLLERPIIVNGDKAAIGRPPENILRIL